MRGMHKSFNLIETIVKRVFDQFSDFFLGQFRIFGPGSVDFQRIVRARLRQCDRQVVGVEIIGIANFNFISIGGDGCVEFERVLRSVLHTQCIRHPIAPQRHSPTLFQ